MTLCSPYSRLHLSRSTWQPWQGIEDFTEPSRPYRTTTRVAPRNFVRSPSVLIAFRSAQIVLSEYPHPLDRLPIRLYADARILCLRNIVA